MNKTRVFGYVGILAVLLAAFLLMGASCSISTANVQNVVTAASVGSDGRPVNSVTEFAVNTPVYVSAELHNAPEDTNVTFQWYSGDTKLDEATVTNTMTDQYVSSHVPGITLAGNFKVEIYVDNREEPDATVAFTVK